MENGNSWALITQLYSVRIFLPPFLPIPHLTNSFPLCSPFSQTDLPRRPWAVWMKALSLVPGMWRVHRHVVLHISLLSGRRAWLTSSQPETFGRADEIDFTTLQSGAPGSVKVVAHWLPLYKAASRGNLPKTDNWPLVIANFTAEHFQLQIIFLILMYLHW